MPLSGGTPARLWRSRRAEAPGLAGSPASPLCVLISSAEPCGQCLIALFGVLCPPSSPLLDWRGRRRPGSQRRSEAGAASAAGSMPVDKRKASHRRANPAMLEGRQMAVAGGDFADLPQKIITKKMCGIYDIIVPAGFYLATA